MTRRQRGWAAAIAVVAALVTAGLVSAVLTRYGPLDRPWGYLALTLAAGGAAAASILCIVRAHQVVEADDGEASKPDEAGPR